MVLTWQSLKILSPNQNVVGLETSEEKPIALVRHLYILTKTVTADGAVEFRLLLYRATKDYDNEFH